MRVLRGRAADHDTDREVTTRALRRAAADGVETVRVWRPHRTVTFGRRDTTAEGYHHAVRIARKQGFEPVERQVGGRAVAHTGTTLSFAVALPDDAPRDRIDDRYDVASRAVLNALRAVGADVVVGEPPRSFCPGSHSIRVRGGGKVVGIAQRVRADAALVAGCVVVESADADAVSGVLEPVYDALDVPLDPDSVGAVANAGGPENPTHVGREVASALVDAPWTDGDSIEPRSDDVEPRGRRNP